MQEYLAAAGLVHSIARAARLATDLQREQADPGASHRLIQRCAFSLFSALAASPWNKLELVREEAVRDFLVDAALDESSFMPAIEQIMTLLFKEKKLVADFERQAEAHDWTKCDTHLLLQNMLACLCGTLPKRSAATLLHVAAGEGRTSIVGRILRLLNSCRGEWADDASMVTGTVLSLLDVNARDTEMKHPLFYAAEGGHVEAAALLLAEKADPDIEVVSMPKIEALAGAQLLAVNARKCEVGTSNAGAGVFGVPAAGAQRGAYFFEVEVDQLPSCLSAQCNGATAPTLAIGWSSIKNRPAKALPGLAVGGAVVVKCLDPTLDGS